MGFLFLKLPPPPCAVLLEYTLHTHFRQVWLLKSNPLPRRANMVYSNFTPEADCELREAFRERERKIETATMPLTAYELKCGFRFLSHGEVLRVICDNPEKLLQCLWKRFLSGKNMVDSYYLHITEGLGPLYVGYDGAAGFEDRPGEIVAGKQVAWALGKAFEGHCFLTFIPLEAERPTENDRIFVNATRGRVPKFLPRFFIPVQLCFNSPNLLDRRKFRSQTSDDMDRWKAEQGRGREKRKIRRKKSRRERVRRKKMQMREKVGKSRNTVFPMICGSGGSKSRLAKAAGAKPAGQMRDEKLHAVVARSTFASQNVQNTPASDHFY